MRAHLLLATARPARMLMILSLLVIVGTTFDAGQVAADSPGDPIAPIPEATLRASRDAATKANHLPGKDTVLASGDGNVRVRVRGAALAEAAELEYVPLDTLPSTGVKVFRQFELNARSAGGARRPIHQFDEPITISLRYYPEDVRGLDDRTFEIAYFNPADNRWEGLPTEHDVEEHTLTATTTHFSIFGGRANPAYALPGAVQNFQADLHAGAAVFSYPIDLPATPGNTLPGISLSYDSSSVNETKNHRDVASWVGTGWSLQLPSVFYNEDLQKHYLSLGGVQAELAMDTAETWYTRPDQNVKIVPSSLGTTSSTRSAAAGSNVGGGTVTWAPMNPPGTFSAVLSSSDNSYAVAVGNFDDTQKLNVTSFGFSIPSTAIINGVEVHIERRLNNGDPDKTARDKVISLLKAGSPGGVNKASGSLWTVNDTIASYGGAADLWGTTWTPAEINAGDFGVQVQVDRAGQSSTVLGADIDHIEIKVYYTDVTVYSPGQTWTVYARNGTKYEFGTAQAWNQYRRTSDVKTYRFDLKQVTNIHGNYMTATFVKYMNPDVSDSVQAAYPSLLQFYANGGTQLFEVVFNRQDGAANRPDLPLGGTGNPEPLVMDKARLSSIEVKVGGQLARKYELSYGSTSASNCTYGNPLKTIYYAGHLSLASITQKGADGSTVADTLTLKYGSGYKQIHYFSSGMYTLDCGVDPAGDENHSASSDLYHPYLESVVNQFGGSVSFTYEQKPAPSTNDIWTRQTAIKRTTNPGPGINPKKSAGAGANRDAGFTDWVAPGNITASDDVRATWTASSGGGGYNNSGTQANAYTGIWGSEYGWTSPASAATSNDVRASVSLYQYEHSNWLRTTNYGFNIPAGATVTGIEVGIEGYKTFGSFVTQTLKIVKGGSETGTPPSGQFWPEGGSGSEAYRTYGGSSDLWGTTWTPSDINSSGFGVSIRVDNFDSSQQTYNVDHIRIKVYYSEPSDFLDATNFNYAVPSTATIQGIEATVERSSNSGNATDQTVQLLKASSPSGSNKASAALWPTSDSTVTYGGRWDLWGASWTPADINNSGFGVEIQAKSGQSGDVARVDHVQVTVHYVDSADDQSVTYAYSGNPEYFVPAGKTPFDGEFRGFREVTATRADNSYEKHYFYTTGRFTVSHPINGSVTRDGDRLKGHEYQSEVYGASGNRLQRLFDDWNYYWVDQAADIYEVRAENHGVEVFDPAGTGVRRRAWNYLTYDGYGNVTRREEVGDTSSSGDERTAFQTFSYNTSAWIVDRPSSIRRFTGSQSIDDPNSPNLRSQSKFYYDNQAHGVAPVKGDLTKEERFVDASNFAADTYGYDTWGNRTGTTDPRGNTTSYSYDSTYHTYPTQTTYPTVPGGTFISGYAWDYVKGVKTSETDWNGQVVTFDYDVLGRPTKVIRPGDDASNPTERYSYLDFGTQGVQRVKVEQRTAGTDYLWQDEYFDGLGRLVQLRQRDDSGNSAITSSVKYNNRGLPSNRFVPWRIPDTTAPGYQTPSGVESTSWTYDALGRVLNETAPDGGATTHAYEGHAASPYLWEERVTDALGKEKRYASNVYGQIAKVDEMQAAQVYRTTTFAYDLNGNLTQVTVDPQLDGALPDFVTTVTFDWLGRKLTLNNPDTGAWSYLYDGNGNLDTQTDARGQVLKFEYDALNRMTKKCATNCSTTVLATYVFDEGTNGKGHRTSLTDQSGSSTYVSDTRGRLSQEVKVLQGSSYTTSYGYDSADRQTTVTIPGGEVLTYVFNNRGLPLSLTSSVSGAIASAATYNRLALLVQLDQGASASRTIQEYWGVEHVGTPSNSQFGRLYKQYAARIGSGTVFQDLRYTWDAVGNLTQREDSLHTTTEGFTYDHLHRLTGASGLYGQTYSYDAHENITFRTGPGNYQYGNVNRPHWVTGTDQNPSAYSYDANGNTIARPGQTLTWNAENLLSEVYVAGGQSIELYAYDADGSRVVKSTQSTTTHYPNRYYEKNITSGSATVYYYFGDRLVATKENGTVRYVHEDHTNSVAAASDSAGAGSWRAYFPWGDVRTSTGSFGTDRSFTGQRSDGTGLYFYNARYYDPSIGRFISPDSLVPEPYDPRDYNRFVYVSNSPLTYTDPSGHGGCAAAVGSLGKAGGGLLGCDFLGGPTAKFGPVGAAVGAAILDWLIRRYFEEGGETDRDAGIFGVETSMPNGASESAKPDNALSDASSPGTPDPNDPRNRISEVSDAVNGAKFASRAPHEAQGVIRQAQQEAEKVAGTRLPQAISGYTKHGLNQAISRDGVGVSARAIFDAFTNPLNVQGQSGGRFLIQGKDAVLIVNSEGKIMTTWARNSAGWRIAP